MRKPAFWNGAPTKRASFVCTSACEARRVSPGGGSIISSQHRAGAEGEGLVLREYLKATYLKPLRDAERKMRAECPSRLSRILGAMPTIGPQSKPAAPGAKVTLHDTLAPLPRNMALRDGDFPRELERVLIDDEPLWRNL